MNRNTKGPEILHSYFATHSVSLKTLNMQNVSLLVQRTYSTYYLITAHTNKRAGIATEIQAGKPRNRVRCHGLFLPNKGLHGMQYLKKIEEGGVMATVYNCIWKVR